MPEQPVKSFDYAQDSTKQILTLSTAVVTISIAVLKDLAKEAPDSARLILYAGWILFAVAILAGVATLLNLTGRVGAAEAAPAGFKDPGVRIFAMTQVLAFLAAMLATVVFGFLAFGTSAEACERTVTQTTTSGDTVTETVRTEDC